MALSVAQDPLTLVMQAAMGSLVSPFMYVRIGSDMATSPELKPAWRPPTPAYGLFQPPIEDQVWRRYRWDEVLPETARPLRFTDGHIRPQTMHVFVDTSNLSERTNRAGWFVAQTLGFAGDAGAESDTIPYGALYFVGMQYPEMRKQDMEEIFMLHLGIVTRRVDYVYHQQNPGLAPVQSQFFQVSPLSVLAPYASADMEADANADADADGMPSVQRSASPTTDDVLQHFLVEPPPPRRRK